MARYVPPAKKSPAKKGAPPAKKGAKTCPMCGMPMDQCKCDMKKGGGRRS